MTQVVIPMVDNAGTNFLIALLFFGLAYAAIRIVMGFFPGA